MTSSLALPDRLGLDCARACAAPAAPPPAPSRRCAVPAAPAKRPRPAVPAVQGQRRGQPQAQSAAGAVPRRPALRRPPRRPYQRRILRRARKRPPSTTLPRSTPSRATSSTRPTSSPTTCSNITTKDTLRGLQPDLLTLTEVAADEPLLRPPHFLSDLRQRARARRRSRRSPTMRTTSSATATSSTNLDEAIAPLAQGRGGGRRRHQADRPQHDRAARQPAEAEARGVALLGAGQELPGGVGRRRQGAADAANIATSITDEIYPGADPAARLPAERISGPGARGRRPHVHEGRRRALPLPGPVDDHDCR